MKKYSILSIIVFAGIVIYSCSKDKGEVPPTYLVFGDSQLSKTSTTIFVPTMEVKSSTNGGEKTDSIDLCDDGIYDILIRAYGMHWASMANSSLESLNNSVEFLVEVIKDTTFYSKNNLNSSINSDTVVYNAYSGFASGQLNDSIVNAYTDYYPGKYPTSFQIDLVSQENIWKSTAILASYSYGFSYYPQGVFNFIQKGIWNDAGENYLCFKIKLNNSVKYGWLKLRVDYNYNIQIFEYSVQI